MNANPLPNSPDALDALLSDFFKAQLKKPWPKAPLPEGARAAEPSELATARAAEAPRNAPSPQRDSTARARFTLAASVALLLGTGWFLADGFQPGPRPGANPVTGAPAHPLLPGSSADGDDHLPLKKIGEDKAKGNDGGLKIDLDGIND